MSGTLLMKSLLNLIRFRLGVVALLLVSGSLWAQTPAAAPASRRRLRPMSASPRLRPTSTTRIRPRVRCVGVAGPGHNAWMMTSSALVLFMTLPGSGALLRRPGAQEERPLRARPVPRHGRPGDHPVVGVRLQPGFRQELQQSVPRRHGILLPEGRHQCAQHRLRLLGFPERVFDVSDDVRDHHPGADRRCDRRAHEVHRDHGFRRRSGCSSSTSRWPTWSGARPAT